MMPQTLPADHPLRIELNDEVHARPPEPLVAPVRVTWLALLTTPDERALGWRLLGELAARYGAPVPVPGASHYSADFGPFRLKCERHTEFVRYQAIVAGAGDGSFADPAIDAVPADWVALLPGQLIAATNVLLLPEAAGPGDHRQIAADYFDGNVLAGAAISGGAASAYTDFRIRPDRFGRILVRTRSTTPWQAGRIVQRLLEIDTYRVMALLALPVARALTPPLARWEAELSGVTGALVTAGVADEPVLLDRLTRLAAEIASRQAENRFRFAAAAAYDELVHRRIADLREERIQGLQTFREFTDRRLLPAMNTCRSAASRQDSVSERVAQAVQLLATRVDLTRERQNQSLLEQMNRRVKLQLRLQSTVEGLSVAAITYYVVSLVGHAAEGLAEVGLHVRPALAMALAIPLVGGLLGFGLHRIRRRVTRSV